MKQWHLTDALSVRYDVIRSVLALIQLGQLRPVEKPHKSHFSPLFSIYSTFFQSFIIIKLFIFSSEVNPTCATNQTVALLKENNYYIFTSHLQIYRSCSFAADEPGLHKLLLLTNPNCLQCITFRHSALLEWSNYSRKHCTDWTSRIEQINRNNQTQGRFMLIQLS